MGEEVSTESKVPGYVSVTIPQERIQGMGITLAEARRVELDQSLRTYDRITFDETRVYHFHTKFKGHVETLDANFVGQFVEKGAPLFSVHSPELYATQNEYLLALRAREQMPLLSGGDKLNPAGAVDLVAATRQRLCTPSRHLDAGLRGCPTAAAMPKFGCLCGSRACCEDGPPEAVSKL
jgi:hypothetical protein